MLHYNDFHIPVMYLILGFFFVVFILLILIERSKILNHKPKKSISLDILINRYAIKQNTKEDYKEKKSDNVEC